MAIKFEAVKPGDLLWDVHKQKLGNTTVSRLSCWPVRVLQIDYDNRVASCSWNGNKPRVYSKAQIERLRRNKPKDLKG